MAVEESDPLVEAVSQDLEKAESLKAEANKAFVEAKYESARELYEQALQFCPQEEKTLRSILLNNCAAVQFHLDAESDESRQLIITRCNESLELNPVYLKPLLRRAKMYQSMGDEKLDEALTDFKRIVELDPRNKEAHSAIYQLEEQIKVRNEKLKDEMLSKLKDLGNLVLKPFGLSTQNFALQQNESGGYSVNFKPS